MRRSGRCGTSTGIPSKSRAVEVEGSDGDTFLIGGVVVSEELGDFKDPARCVLTIKSRNIKLKSMRCRVWQWCTVRRARTRSRRWFGSTAFQGVKAVSDISHRGGKLDLELRKLLD
jgi:hypothetical protein